MVRNLSLCLGLMAVSMLWSSTGVSGGNYLNQDTFQAARTETYRDSEKRLHRYQVQEPKDFQAKPNILIYMHGSAGKEEQGMDLQWERGTFARLRILMNRWRWVYVCPRDAEFDGLLKHLEETYAPQDIYLAGASGGGNIALWEAQRNPSAYAGLLLLCPAIKRRKSNNPSPPAMPVWIVSATRDRKITQKCRVLVRELESLQSPCFYREIAGGHHGTPLQKVHWQKALEFLQGKRRELVASLAIASNALEPMAPLSDSEAPLSAEPTP